jgi:Flp pilus assembly protein CpaB
VRRFLGRRWSPAAKLFLALAVVCGTAAFTLVNGYTRRVDALAPALGEPVDVVVAARDLSRGTWLVPDALEVRRVPSAFAPPGAIRSIERAVGRSVLTDVARGEAITATRLASTRVGPVAALVPEGFVAFAVATSLPGGSVRPGDRVDVLATFAGGQPHTETVADGLEVLLVAAGGRLVEDPQAGEDAAASGIVDANQAPVLFLLVSGHEAERLAYARAFADLAVVIAGSEDDP